MHVDGINQSFDKCLIFMAYFTSLEDRRPQFQGDILITKSALNTETKQCAH